MKIFNPSQILSRIFKSSSRKEIEKLKSVANKINDYEALVQKLDDSQFAKKTIELKSKVQKEGINLNQVLPEAFAYVREAAKRALNERPFDVQILGAIVLHQGKIAEMKTGEGKTLVSTLPVYLNALEGKGTHVVTVNDYLARRDSDWMGKIYNFMGISVGCITNELDDEKRKKNYNCDVTYGTNNEFGFDYLRDNMKYDAHEMVQREHHYCIVDEVDSILIDEARTPLIISGSVEDKSDKYILCDKLVKNLDKKDYEIDEKEKSAILSDGGIDKIEKLLISSGKLKNNNFYDSSNISLVHHVNLALRANYLFSKDTDYIVRDNKVQIIDEFTGRMLEGRRYSDGLHQALESKEKVEIQSENQTLASVTYQNYFRLYKKLAGMTGTALTEAEEFFDIYKLNTISIPTNVKMIRKDLNDQIFRTEKEKNLAIVRKIKRCNQEGQPVLVGTVSIEKSEKISELLNKEKIKHNVLNAKHHEKEAKIIEEAGKLGAVTIATNMAGRGTDIQLAGNLNSLLKTNSKIEFNAKEPETIKKNHSVEKNKIKEKGGLFVVATERHESRRIDNQLRGRSGRQGDPGNSIFYVSLEDDLMRIFGSESIDAMLKKFGFKESDSIDHPWINKALERAQKKVESRNFDIRKTLLQFDDVMNDQRQVIFSQRKEVLTSKNVSLIIDKVLDDITGELSNEKNNLEKINKSSSLKTKLKTLLGRSVSDSEIDEINKLKDEKFEQFFKDKFIKSRSDRIKVISDKSNQELEKRIFLQTIDFLWRAHLQYLEHLRQVIGFRSYGQKDPLIEFKKESFELFKNLLQKLKFDTITFLNNLMVVESQKREKSEPIKKPENLSFKDQPTNCLLILKKNEKISRNERCEATGKKFKYCCGAL